MQTNRRIMLAAIAAAPLAACGATPAFASATSAAISPALADLIARHAAADAALEHFYATVFNPAVDAHRAAVDEHRAAVDAVPYVEELGGCSVGGGPVIFSSRKGHSRKTAEHYIACDQDQPNRGGDWNKMIDAARRFIRADDSRKQAVRDLGEEPVLDPSVEARERAAYAPFLAARAAIHSFACNSLADLRAKLAWIESGDGMDGEDLLPIVIADVQRLIGGEA
jgi:hypothetical protein